MLAEDSEYRREEEETQCVSAQKDEGIVYLLTEIWLQCQAENDDKTDNEYAANRGGLKRSGIGDEHQQSGK
jgi:hypothetical protein